ncbi:hypothetical protein PDIG_89750 [Penicillium digitatum PHI26]|uniref:Uncharacterized protein n=2 Tax=Penicillium digitatum TaxID=36651 RepID=K9F4X5_PEND2|nr:hypothetical protein PDIP_06680 [Penicillium digitatum Pd1]EKV04340.1 hypothetical protein PDIG_89750 [Penicillium digitatum PHI26]EKV21409.1 hypothetical protein PDIP_06680 [Penicillium digitatum Pd1]
MRDFLSQGRSLPSCFQGLYIECVVTDFRVPIDNAARFPLTGVFSKHFDSPFIQPGDCLSSEHCLRRRFLLHIGSPPSSKE